MSEISKPRGGLRWLYRGDTIGAMKIAISLPDSVFEAAEDLAKELHIPRSQLYAQALSSYLSIHSRAAVTAKLNAVHGTTAVHLDPALNRAQLQSLDHEAW